MDQIDRKKLKVILLSLAAATAVICLVTLFFYRTDLFSKAASKAVSILMPFIWGFVIAYLLIPVCDYFERLMLKLTKGKRKGLSRLISILLSLLFMLLVLYFLIMSVLPELISSISSLVSQIPGAIQQFEDWLSNLDNSGLPHDAVVAIEGAVQTVSDKISSFLQTDLLPYLQTMITGVTSSFMGIVSLLKNFGLGCIISAYLLSGREKFLAQVKLTVYAVLPEKAADWIREEVHYADRMFSGFIHGKLLDSLIIGIICFVFMLIAKMPYAVLVSIVVGVTNIIPFFGPYLGAIPSAVIILTVSPVKCVVFVIFIIILQQVDGNVIGPRILGDRVGLSSFWILFSILVFGALWGFVGMVVGVPVFAVLYDIVRSFVVGRLEKKGEEELLEEYSRQFSSGEK